MKLRNSAEQELFRKSLRAFLRDQVGEAVTRRLMTTDTGHDEVVWKKMAAQLGLQGLIIPEAFGGSGYSQQELAVVMEEFGRALAGGPYFPTVVLAVNALLLSGDQRAQAEFLPRIAEGRLIATVALTDESASWGPDGLTVRAVMGSDGWILSGAQSFVLSGHLAELLLFVADTQSGPSLFAVDRGAPGVIITSLTTMDMTRRQAHVEMVDTPARLIGDAGTGLSLFTRLSDLACTALAAEQVGGAQRVLEMAVEYAKTRTQFGREIGSFQAIKHKCADVLVEVESARSTAGYAALAAATDSPDLHVAACLAQLRCSQTYLKAAEENILIHGAIGFTWEHRAQLFYKRASADALYLGGPSQFRARLAEALELVRPEPQPV